MYDIHIHIIKRQLNFKNYNLKWVPKNQVTKQINDRKNTYMNNLENLFN